MVKCGKLLYLLTCKFYLIVRRTWILINVCTVVKFYLFPCRQWCFILGTKKKTAVLPCTCTDAHVSKWVIWNTRGLYDSKKLETYGLLLYQTHSLHKLMIKKLRCVHGCIKFILVSISFCAEEAPGFVDAKIMKSLCSAFEIVVDWCASCLFFIELKNWLGFLSMFCSFYTLASGLLATILLTN
jgi:hypothetical protein